ncbi:hypothetical protein AAF712_009989 [Marasmius tenuissimus]|uniref:Heterokaryon incompatibility domain-containing protein n=1 Tax=Marasmius tenuissimus TaxID=585030 RepID=A0ABR2ZPL3_9AGAR
MFSALARTITTYLRRLIPCISPKISEGDEHSNSSTSDLPLVIKLYKAHPQLEPEPKRITSDLSSPIADLRWIGPVFLYFPDIPWTRLPPKPNPGSIEATSVQLSEKTCIPWMQDLILGALSDLTQSPVDAESLLAPNTDGELVLSGEKVSRLIVPHMRTISGIIDVDVSAVVQSFNDRIVPKIRDLDGAVLSESIRFLEPGHPYSHRFLTVGTTLMGLCQCVRVALKDGTAFDALDHSRISLGLIELYRGELQRNWSGQNLGLEIERLVVGGLAFIAYTASCSPTQNKSKAINPANYRPLHTTPHCTCEFMKPPVDEIKNILASDRIPVVALDEANNLIVHDSARQVYMAISHVWADGLGSTTEEGLPRCQVTRLAGLAFQAVPGGAFWLDALCIPNDKEPRKRAIRLMAATYENAEKVLVIDGGVRTQSSLSSPTEELLMRIATSGWMQRIWTLQEGMLAQRLTFEVSDGIIDSTRFNGGPYGVALRTLAFLQHRPHDDEKRELASVCPKPPRCSYNDIIPLLRHRKTSKPEDEPLAVAGVLGVNSSRLITLEGLEARMRELLLQCKTLPRSIGVTGWNSQKLGLPGFSWAPASISQVLWGTEWQDPLSATVTPDGLRARYTLIRFPEKDMLRVVGFDATIRTQPTDSPEGYKKLAPGLNWEGVSELVTRPEPVTSGVDMVISPWFVRAALGRQQEQLLVNAVLIVRPGLPPTTTDEAFAAVYIPSSHGNNWTEENPLECRFVAPGRLIVDPAGVRGTNRVTGDQSIRIEATLDPLIPVLLT